MELNRDTAPLTFIVLEKPGDITNHRSTIASVAATSVRRQTATEKSRIHSEEPTRSATPSILIWRSGIAPVKQKRIHEQGRSRSGTTHRTNTEGRRAIESLRMAHFVRSPQATHVGLYRHDPFASYPIKATGTVQHTVDFCRYIAELVSPQFLLTLESRHANVGSRPTHDLRLWEV